MEWIPLIVLHGDDEFAITEQVREFTRAMQQDDPSQLNVAILEGRQSSEEELQTALNTLPFLAEHRLVVLKGLAHRQDGARFTNLLEKAPASTTLVVELLDSFERGSWRSADPARHWLAKWVQANPKKSRWQEFRLPSLYNMPAWLQKQTQAMGGKIAPAAADQLTEFIGNDTRLAVLELDKLLNYVDRARPISAADVAALTSNQATGNIFQLVDALAEKNRRATFMQLEKLSEEMEPAQLFGMIVRQYRLMIQAREVMEDGGAESELTREVAEIRSPMVAKKVWQQARRYSLGELKEIYHRLLLCDQAMKTSTMSPELAIEAFLSENTSPS